MSELLNDITSFSNLLKAYKKVKKGTNNGYDAQKFSFNLEHELLDLQFEIVNGLYRPGSLKKFKIFDPKEREISAAPIRDRVVYHAIFNILEPFFEKYMISDSFACRKGKGTHAAVKKAQACMRRNRWYLKADVMKYFESINHNKLFRTLENLVKDQKILSLFERILNVDGAVRGLPIGNLTSQHFANLYLSRFDHYIKDFLGYKHYVRYMDDFVVFSDDKEKLKQLLPDIRRYMKNELDLELKESAVFINKDQNGLSFLGWRIYKKIIRIKRENYYRSIARIRGRYFEYKKGLFEDEKLAQSLASLSGHLGYFDTKHLLQKFFRGVNTAN